jgi:hypothetical protein
MGVEAAKLGAQPGHFDADDRVGGGIKICRGPLENIECDHGLAWLPRSAGLIIRYLHDFRIARRPGQCQRRQHEIAWPVASDPPLRRLRG